MYILSKEEILALANGSLSPSSVLIPNKRAIVSTSGQDIIDFLSTKDVHPASYPGIIDDVVVHLDISESLEYLLNDLISDD